MFILSCWWGPMQLWVTLAFCIYAAFCTADWEKKVLSITYVLFDIGCFRNHCCPVAYAKGCLSTFSCLLALQDMMLANMTVNSITGTMHHCATASVIFSYGANLHWYQVFGTFYCIIVLQLVILANVNTVQITSTWNSMLYNWKLLLSRDDLPSL